MKKLKKRGLKVQLIYKTSPEANFRLLQALKMLLSEEDIRKYFASKNNYGDTKNDTNK